MQGYGFSSMWTLMWLFRWIGWLHALHVNGLSPNVTLQVVRFRLSVCHIPDTDMVSPKCGYSYDSKHG